MDRINRQILNWLQMSEQLPFYTAKSQSHETHTEDPFIINTNYPFFPFLINKHEQTYNLLSTITVRTSINLKNYH